MKEKPYIFPDGRYDPGSVPEPWIKHIQGMEQDAVNKVFAMQLLALREWYTQEFDKLDNEDRLYGLYLFYLMGNPLFRHEAMNLFVVMKQFVT